MTWCSDVALHKVELVICPNCKYVHSNWAYVYETMVYVCGECNVKVTAQALMKYQEDVKMAKPKPPANKHSDHVHVGFAMKPADVQAKSMYREASQFSSRDTVYGGMNFGFDKPPGYYEQRLLELQRQLDEARKANFHIERRLERIRDHNTRLTRQIGPALNVAQVAYLVMEQLQDETYADDLESMEAKDKDAYLLLDALQDAVTDFLAAMGEVKPYKKGPKNHEPDIGESHGIGPYIDWEAAYSQPHPDDLVPVPDDDPFPPIPSGKKLSMSDMDAAIKELYAPKMQEHMNAHMKLLQELKKEVYGTEDGTVKPMKGLQDFLEYTEVKVGSGVVPVHKNDHLFGIPLVVAQQQAGQVVVYPKNESVKVHSFHIGQQYFSHPDAVFEAFQKGLAKIANSMGGSFQSVAYLKVSHELFHLLKLSMSFQTPGAIN